jgi:signal transduction histidine kinase
MFTLFKFQVMRNLYLLFFPLFCNAAFAQNKYIDSLKTLTSSKVDTIRFWAYSELIWELKDKDKKSALKYGVDLLNESKKSDKKRWIAQGYNDIGIIYYRGGNLKLALENFEPSLAIRKKLGNKKDIASSLSKIAVVKAENKEYNKALELQLEVLKIYEELKILPYIAQTCNNIGQLCNYTKNFLLVRKYLSRAYAIGEKLKDANTMSLTMFALATNYYNLKNIDSAIVCYDIAKGKFKTAGNLAGYATSCSNLGQMYQEQGKSKAALLAYKEAIEIGKSINDSSSVASFESHYADFLITENKLGEAEKILLNALAISKKLGHGNIEVNNFQQLTNLYIQTKNSEQAAFYFKKYQTIKDSIFSNENARQFSEMQTKYETERKETEIKLLKQDNEIKDFGLKQNRLFILGLIVVLLALIIVGYLWQNRAKLKQNLELEATRTVLRESQLKAVIGSQEEERKRFAADLHDGLGQIISAVRLSISKENPQKETIDHAVSLLSDMNAEIRNIAFNLMPQALMNDGLEPALQQFAARINRAGGAQVSVQAFSLAEKMTSETKIALYRICQEWVNNVLKYSHCSTISIQLVQHPDELVVTIEDNGKGFDPHILTYSQGNGWKNINSRLALIKGSIEIDSQQNREGTTVIISAPRFGLTVSYP